MLQQRYFEIQQRTMMNYFDSTEMLKNYASFDKGN